VKLRLRAAVLLFAVAALVLWRSHLFVVARPGSVPRPLAVIESPRRSAARFDVILPLVPVGAERLSAGGTVLVVHYWAPWERHAARQAATLDSLAHLEQSAFPRDGARLRVVIVCFDPFPSLARYVARQRLRLPVLLDSRRELQAALPCPSVPFTYVLDPEGRVAVAQAGEVDWLGSGTRDALCSIAASQKVPAPAAVPS
jgi:hypothetical protein